MVSQLSRPPPRFPGHHSHFSQHHHPPPSTGQTSSTLNSSIVPVQPGKYIGQFYSY